jgi:serine/threonine protein kinase
MKHFDLNEWNGVYKCIGLLRDDDCQHQDIIKVYSIHNNKNNSHNVGPKVITKERSGPYSQIDNELDMMQYLPDASKHNICLPIATVGEKTSKSPDSIVLPFFETDLEKFYIPYWQKGIPIPTSHIIEITLQMIVALAYIEKNNIIHHDLNFNNVFLTTTKNNINQKEKSIDLAIGDFGVAEHIKDNLEFGEASHRIMGHVGSAPEKQHQSKELPSVKTNIYQFGSIIQALLFTGRSFQDIEKSDSKIQLLFAIVTLCTKQNQQERPSANNLVKVLFESELRLSIDKNS